MSTSTPAILVDPTLLATTRPPTSRPPRSKIGVAAHLSRDDAQPASLSATSSPPLGTSAAPPSHSETLASAATIPSLHASTSATGAPGPSSLAGAGLIIDPRLFELQSVVNSVRSVKGKGKESLQSAALTVIPDTLSAFATSANQDTTLQTAAIDTRAEHQLDDGMDPNVREIVNSLANAQQEQARLSGSNPHQQDTLAFSGSSLDTDADTIDQAIQSSLADFTAEQLNTLFPPTYHSPSTSRFLLPDPPSSSFSNTPIPGLNAAAAAGTSTNSHALAPTDASLSIPGLDHVPAKRSRGRPKGSKNKTVRPPAPPKPRAPRPRKPVPADQPPKRIGRPPKQRSEAEQAEYDRRREEKRLGISRPRGRPRHFPGHLVRELRLKANREEFRAVVHGARIASARDHMGEADGDAVGEDGGAFGGPYWGDEGVPEESGTSVSAGQNPNPRPVATILGGLALPRTFQAKRFAHVIGSTPLRVPEGDSSSFRRPGDDLGLLSAETLEGDESMVEPDLGIGLEMNIDVEMEMNNTLAGVIAAVSSGDSGMERGVSAGQGGGEETAQARGQESRQGEGEGGGNEVRDGDETDEDIPEDYDWANDPQNLIDAMAGQFKPV